MLISAACVVLMLAAAAPLVLLIIGVLAGGYHVYRSHIDVANGIGLPYWMLAGCLVLEGFCGLVLCRSSLTDNLGGLAIAGLLLVAIRFYRFVTAGLRKHSAGD